MHANLATRPLSRRDALRSLAIFASGAALARYSPAAAFAADSPAPARPTTEPTGNPGIDANLSHFEFTPLNTVNLAPGLALLSGPGGNMVVLTGPDGALIVDTGVHPTAPAVAKAAEAAAGRPVTTVVNTHWHFDHTGGNEFFGARGAHIIAHDNVRARMSTTQHIDAFDFTFQPSPAAALPVVGFPSSLSLYFGNEKLSLHHVEPAHTDGDIHVFFEKANVLHMGDTFFNGFYPFIDYSSMGWLGGMVAASDTALAFCNAQTRIIPGHGPMGGVEDLKATREMLNAVLGRIDKLLDAGKNVDEVVAAAPTRDYDAKWGKGMFDGAAFTKVATAGVIKHRNNAKS